MIDLGELNVDNILDTENLILLLEEKIDKELIKDSIVKLCLINVNNKLLLDFNENKFINFFKECFYFEYKKIKIQNEKSNFNMDIYNTNDIIGDNFLNFLKGYDLKDLDKKNILENELKELLKNI
jgi:hypothetical protein